MARFYLWYDLFRPISDVQTHKQASKTTIFLLDSSLREEEQPSFVLLNIDFLSIIAEWRRVLFETSSKNVHWLEYVFLGVMGADSNNQKDHCFSPDPYRKVLCPKVEKKKLASGNLEKKISKLK